LLNYSQHVRMIGKSAILKLMRFTKNLEQNHLLFGFSDSSWSEVDACIRPWLISYQFVREPLHIIAPNS
jgi:hypothetical protein